MTKKEVCQVLFGLFSLLSGIACFFWATTLRSGVGFLIGGFWAAMMPVFQQLFEGRISQWLKR
jgi:uncharacterized membrane protein YvlD (DUF360 family)